MPLTFPSHAALVLPLKRWRPRWFDGVALVIGSASPDLAYALDGSGLPVYPLSHQWSGVVLFCLPVTMLAGALVRWAAPAVAAHLPGRLTAYGILGCRRPRLIVTATSAILGAASHLIWDRLAVGVFDLTSTVIGAAVAIFLFVRYPPLPDIHALMPPDHPARPAPKADAVMHDRAEHPSRSLLTPTAHAATPGGTEQPGRTPLTPTAHAATPGSTEQPGRSPLTPTDNAATPGGTEQPGTAQLTPVECPSPQRRPALFWPVALSVAGLGVVVALRLPAAFLVHTTGARVLIALAAGTLAATVCVRALRPVPSRVG